MWDYGPWKKNTWNDVTFMPDSCLRAYSKLWHESGTERNSSILPEWRKSISSVLIRQLKFEREDAKEEKYQETCYPEICIMTSWVYEQILNYVCKHEIPEGLRQNNYWELRNSWRFQRRHSVWKLWRSDQPEGRNLATDGRILGIQLRLQKSCAPK